MKKNFIIQSILVLLALGRSAGQTFIPVTTTGYNLDGVAENTTAVSTTGGALDASDFALYSQFYGTLYSGGTVGLPNNGLLTSGSRSYQLASYTGSNVLHTLAGAVDSLTFVTPQAFPVISLLCFGTQGNATASITVRFTDNSTQVFSPMTLTDWFTVTAPLFSGFDRVLRSSGAPALVGSAGNPRMMGLDLNILCGNQGKPIKRVIVRNTSTNAAHTCVMAVAGAVPAYSVSGNPLLCSGSSTTLNASGFSTYTWEPVGSFAGSNSATINISPASSTIYTLTGTDMNGCPGYTTVSVNVSSSAPVLSLAGSTQSICLGAAATITASGALSYTLSSPAPNGAAFTPTSTTVYTVTGSNGCGSVSLNTTITVTPLPVTAATSSSLVCAGSNATLSAGGATSYTWMPGPSTQTNYIASPTANTIYTVTGKSGNCVATNTVAVQTKPLPSISITAASSVICQGDSVNLGVSGNALTYTWSPGNQTSTSVYVSPLQPFVYTVTATNSVNCSSSAQQVILVNPVPVLSISVTNPVVCAGNASGLNALGATSYAWSTLATGPSATVNPTGTSTYTVTGSFATGCSSTATVSVAVFTPSISVSGNTAVCQGSLVNISASGASSYTWINNGIPLPSIGVSPAATTIYTVTGDVTDQVSNVICPASNTLQVTVNPNPTITAVSNRTNNAICRGEAVLLTAAGAGAGSYLWSGGSLSSTQATASASPFLTQVYNVSGTDANGCKGSAQLTIQVSLCTGIEAISTNPAGVRAYPNPASGAIVIGSDRAATLVVINELGQAVRHLDLNADNAYRVTVEGLAPGIYFVSGAGGIHQKFVIEP